MKKILIILGGIIIFSISIFIFYMIKSPSFNKSEFKQYNKSEYFNAKQPQGWQVKDNFETESTISKVTFFKLLNKSSDEHFNYQEKIAIEISVWPTEIPLNMDWLKMMTLQEGGVTEHGDIVFKEKKGYYARFLTNQTRKTHKYTGGTFNETIETLYCHIGKGLFLKLDKNTLGKILYYVVVREDRCKDIKKYYDKYIDVGDQTINSTEFNI